MHNKIDIIQFKVRILNFSFKKKEYPVELIQNVCQVSPKWYEYYILKVVILDAEQNYF